MSSEVTHEDAEPNHDSSSRGLCSTDASKGARLVLNRDAVDPQTRLSRTGHPENIKGYLKKAKVKPSAESLRAVHTVEDNR